MTAETRTRGAGDYQFIRLVYDQVPPKHTTAQAMCDCLWAGPQRSGADSEVIAATDAFAHHLRDGHIVIPALIDGISWPAGATAPRPL